MSTKLIHCWSSIQYTCIFDCEMNHRSNLHSEWAIGQLSVGQCQELQHFAFNPFTARLSRIGAKLEMVLVNGVGQL